MSESPGEPPAPTSLPPALRRAQWRPLRLAIAAALVAAVVLAALYHRANSQRRALLGVQQACLRYDLPATQVVYDEDPTRATELLAEAGPYVAATAPDGPPIAALVPQPWRDMRKWAMPGEPASPDHAVLFLHERQTLNGVRGLICVQADRLARELRVTFVHPGGETLDPVAIANVSVIPRPQEGLILLTPGGDPFADRLSASADAPSARVNLRFFSGVADARDPSHATITYERDGQRGVIDLWIADERTVHFAHHRLAP